MPRKYEPGLTELRGEGFFLCRVVVVLEIGEEEATCACMHIGRVLSWQQKSFIFIIWGNSSSSISLLVLKNVYQGFNFLKGCS